ncbi:MAG: endonuclease/exonuclease/phosphatase family protein [Aureliella sp.]
MRTRSSILCLTLLCLTSFAARSGEAQVIVMSYNIRYLNKTDGDDVWPNRSADVVKTLGAADLVGLQEVVDEQLRHVREGRQEFAWFGVGREDGKKAGEAAPIGWRKSKFEAIDRGVFWLSETPEVVGSKGWDAALPRIATWARLEQKSGGGELLLINTHFDHRGAEARAESAKQIQEWISKNKGDAGVVLTGDFNATLKQTPITNLLSGDLLKNARDVSQSKDPGPNSTWNGFREIVDNRRIDFIFVAGLKVERFETLNPKTEAGRFASDHLPVVAVVK